MFFRVETKLTSYVAKRSTNQWSQRIIRNVACNVYVIYIDTVQNIHRSDKIIKIDVIIATSFLGWKFDEAKQEQRGQIKKRQEAKTIGTLWTFRSHVSHPIIAALWYTKLSRWFSPPFKVQIMSSTMRYWWNTKTWQAGMTAFGNPIQIVSFVFLWKCRRLVKGCTHHKLCFCDRDFERAFEPGDCTWYCRPGQHCGHRLRNWRISQTIARSS